MIRTTDAMLKAVAVQKAKERLQDSIDARAKAKALGRNDLLAMFDNMIAAGRSEVATAEAFLKNPAW